MLPNLMKCFDSFVLFFRFEELFKIVRWFEVARVKHMATDKISKNEERSLALFCVLLLVSLSFMAQSQKIIFGAFRATFMFMPYTYMA